MLREQLAKLQSELRLARGQIATQEIKIARSITPSTKNFASFGSTTPTRTSLNRSKSHHNLSSPSSASASAASLSSSSSSSSIINLKKSHSTSPVHKNSSPKRSKSKRSKGLRQSNSENTDGLSIRFISGAGISPPAPVMPSATYVVSPELNSTPGLPSTDSGYVKDTTGNWVPLRSLGREHLSPTSTSSLTNSPPPNGHQTPLSRSQSDQSKGLSRIPVSAVSLGRVLAGDMSASKSRRDPDRVLEEIEEAGDDGETGETKHSGIVNSSLSDRPPSAAGSASNASRQSRTNPFFSSGVGRDRGAMIHQQHDRLNAGQGNNTTRVITTLQTDLLYSRTALDQSKSQLRLSQRTVESLSRQNEDLKESMARLRLENEGLSKMLNRKERTVSELMDRIKKSESEASTLKQERKEIDITLKKLTKESDEIVKDSLKKKDRAESQYEAIKSGVKSLNEAWKRDVSGLKDDLAKIQDKHRKEMEDSRLKYQTLAKLHASRSSSLSTLESNVNSLNKSKQEFVSKYSIEIENIKDRLKEDEKLNKGCMEMTNEVYGECKRFKRILRDHASSN
ncbi:hypothetical protein BY996DRAFT_4573163 [Phakopsora pachyrhizi]|nr:hypothetical protein BY996DRAFT_4573163 [Phakopsora pachyrhizi]